MFWRSLITAILIFMIIIFSVQIRFMPRNIFTDGYMPDPDNYRMVRQVRQIVELGHLPDVDEQRWAPIGRDNSTQATLAPYLIAFAYNVIQLIMPDTSLESVTKTYPVVVFAILAFMFYFLVKLIFDSVTALFSVIALSMAPWLLLPTSYGNPDHDAISILFSSVTLLLYIGSMIKSGKFTLLLTLGSGITMSLLAMTWVGVGIYAVIIVSGETWRLISGYFHSKDMKRYACLFLPYIITCLLFKKVYHDISIPWIFIAIIPPVLFFVISTFYSLLMRFTSFRFYGKTIAVSIGILSCAVFTIISSFDPNIPNLSILWNSIFTPFGDTQIAQSINELAPLPIKSWWITDGVLPVLSYLGVGIMIVKSIRVKPVIPLILVIIFILSIHTAYWPLDNHEVPPRDSLFNLGKWTLPFVLLAFFILLTYGIIQQWRSSKIADGIPPISEASFAYLFLISWLLITLALTLAGARYIRLFNVPMSIAIGYAISFLISKLTKEPQREHWLGLCLAGATITWQFRAFGRNWISEICSLFGFLINQSFQLSFGISLASVTICLMLGLYIIRHELAKSGIIRLKWTGLLLASLAIFSGLPGYTGTAEKAYNVFSNYESSFSSDMQNALNWIGKHLSSEATIVCVWDYSDRINYLTPCKTIIDAEQVFPIIKTIYKDIFLAPVENVGQLFYTMKHFKATHILLDSSYFYKMKYIVNGAGYEKAPIPEELVPVCNSQEQSKELIFVGNLREPPLYESDVTIKVPVLQTSSGLMFSQPLLVTASGKQKIAEIAYLGRSFIYDEADIDGALYLYHLPGHGQDIYGFYIPSNLRQTLLVRLLLLSEFPGFTCIYPEADKDKYSSVKLFSIQYPERLDYSIN